MSRSTEVAIRSDYRLSDNLAARSGQVFLTGTQALVRLLLMQRALDAAQGLNTAGFVSGYRGSPLGMVDQQLWKAKHLLDQAGIEFLPAINEDLAATACLGTQRVALDPKRRADGVFAMWYGKGPGVDRSGDALKHGNAYGSSPLGGVLVVAGDDHGCVSSSMPHQSDLAMQAWSMPVLHPANVAEYLEFGLYGWALSRFSGAWVGFKAISEVVESGMTVDLDRVPLAFEHRVDYAPPPEVGSLHVRAVDLPSLAIEQRLAHKLDAVRAFARVNSVDTHVVTSPRATLGIVTVGKAHFDFMEVLRRLDLDPDALAAAGVRVYKVGLVYPLEPTRILEFVLGLEEILVIEEKAPVVERQIKELLYHLPDTQRPRVSGKTDANGAPLLPTTGELRPSRVMPVVAEWLARLNPALDRRALVVDFTMPALLSNEADAVRRLPYFCSGCPHNTSTRVPSGSRALAGIGCHFMASWMDRDTSGLIQMGAEGVDWVAHSRFTDEPHVFQNLGDGTYYHSGYLAIRQAIAAGATITYKVLYNDAVAMTGGQPVDGRIGVPEIARQVEAEGARAVAIVSDDPAKYEGHEKQFPRGTTFHDRSELDAVQRRLRAVAGVTVLIYDQTCAAEKRRRRKKNEYPDPPRRMFINEQVCEGCGDCGVQSNCLSVIPVETDWGRKRRIEQTSCNKDYSCVNGFCPSFVSVEGATVRKRVGSEFTPEDLQRELAAIEPPAPWRWTGPFDLLVTGVGGTGVVTVGALVTMAAHLEGKQASVLDFMGFAQKGGAVLSFVRLAQTPDLLNQVRIDTQQADALLACDLVVGASPDALATVKHGRTMILANTHELATAAFVRDPNATLRPGALLAKMRAAAGDDRVHRIDAQSIAERLLGDTMPSNIVMLGFAWQMGLIPVSEAALARAIELNGVAVELNRTAFALGRLAAAAPQAIERLAGANVAPAEPLPDWLDLDGDHGLIARRSRWLADYQDDRYAARYRALVDRVRAAETAALGSRAASTPLRLTAAVARHAAKLMAYKDEYEVARLYTSGVFERSLSEQFERWQSLRFHMAPPLLAMLRRFRRPDGTPRKLEFGSWMLPALRLLAKGRRLRGTALDPFGHTAERKLERQLIAEYEAMIDALLPGLDSQRLALAAQIASVPEQIRGFGHVKLAAIATARARWHSLLEQFHRGAPAAPVAASAPRDAATVR
ncbi:MAG TPA: indolepyruvate ferredoxin oxidoreductase family protein [Burkholderiaceae bacterium]|nr:indolepyruvate ferredoxin oxidoreductase family protein [Burkholderiaceae bacterium]